MENSEKCDLAKAKLFAQERPPVLQLLEKRETFWLIDFSDIF